MLFVFKKTIIEKQIMKILGSKESVKMSFSTHKHNMQNKRQLGNSCWGGGAYSKITDLSTTLDTLVIAKR